MKVALLVPAGTLVVVGVVLALFRLFAGDGLSGLGSATASGWLAVNQVPTTIGGVTIGVLPLLPTLIVVACTAAVVAEGASTARELADLAGLVGAALGGPLLVTALSLAVVADGSAVTSIGQPDSLPAFGYTLLVQGIGVLIGVAVPSLRPVLDEFAVPATERVGARGGIVAFVVLIAGGAAAVFVGIVMHWSSVSALIGDGNTFDGYLGLTGLSILYLPNLVVGAAAVSVGSSAELGGSVFDVFETSRGAMPPLPVVAALPESSAGTLGALYFLVPVVAGVVLGWYCRSTDPQKHLRAVAIGAVVAATLVVIVSWLGGGQLGELGHAGVNVPTAGVFTFGWMLLAGGVVVGVMWLADGGLQRGDGGDDLDDWLDDEQAEAEAESAAGSDADADADAESDPQAGGAEVADDSGDESRAATTVNDRDDEPEPAGTVADDDPTDAGTTQARDTRDGGDAAPAGR